MKILNLTQYPATAEQIEAGNVIEPADKQAVCELLAFSELPTRQEISRRSIELANLALVVGFADTSDEDYNTDVEAYPTHAMIEGPAFFMSSLESALLDVGITPVYAFHAGFVEV